MAARTDRAQRLVQGLLGAEALKLAVWNHPVEQGVHRRHAGVAALLEHGVGADFAAEGLPGRVP